MTRIRTAGYCIPLWLLLGSTCGFAESNGTEPADEDDFDRAAVQEQVVVTATRTERRSSDVAFAVTAVDADAILRQSPALIAEVLRGQPGAYFQQTTPGQGIPIIRGLKGSQVLHLVDGMRLNNAFFRSAPNQYLALVDTFATDRVELVRGASPSLYGADAMGGVVQLLTADPVFDSPEWQNQGRIHAAWNSANNGLALRAQASGGRDGTGLSGGVTWMDYGNRRTANGTVSPSGYEVQAGDFKWLQSLSPDSELMISAQVLEQPKTPRIDELVPGFGQQQPSSSEFWFLPNKRSFLHGRYRMQRDQGWFEKLEIHLARQVIRDDRRTRDFGQPVVTDEQNESTLDGLTIQLDSTLPGDTLLTWGAEFYADSIDSSRQQSIPGVSSPLAVRSRFPNDSSMDSLAFYANSEWRITPRLNLSGGLRWSKFDITLPAGTDNARAVLKPDDLTGDIHLVFALNDETHLVANAGRGFRPPNIFDLGTLGARPGNRFNIANPDLEAESVWSYDIGIKMVHDYWQAELFGWYSDYKDKITSVATGELTPSGRVIVKSENRNQVTLYGLEAGLRWFPGENTRLITRMVTRPHWARQRSPLTAFRHSTAGWV
jgi:outer membrane receptor protein involved in Fe transport